MASDLLNVSLDGNQPLDIASWLGDDQTSFLDLPQVQFGDVDFTMSSPEALSPLNASPQSPASPYTNDAYMNPSAIFDFGDVNWQAGFLEPETSFIDENTLQQLQAAITQDIPQCPSPLSEPQSPQSPESPPSPSSTGSEGETVNKKKRSHSQIDTEEVCLPRATLLAMSSKEIEEYAAKLKQQRPLTVAEEKEFKRQRRLIKNREYASQSRNRKKAYVDDIEKKMSDVAAENAALKEQLQSLAYENKTLKKQVDTVVEVLKRAPAKVAASFGGAFTIGSNNVRHKVGPKTVTCLAVLFMILSFQVLLGDNRLPTASPTSVRTFPPSRVLLNYQDPWIPTTVETQAVSESSFSSNHPPTPSAEARAPVVSSSSSAFNTHIIDQPLLPLLDTAPEQNATTTRVSFIYNPAQSGVCSDNQCADSSFKPASPLLQFETLEHFHSSL